MITSAITAFGARDKQDYQASLKSNGYRDKVMLHLPPFLSPSSHSLPSGLLLVQFEANKFSQ